MNHQFTNFDSVVELAHQLGRLVAQTQAVDQNGQLIGSMICTAESCTGGLIAAALTEISGSSGWFDSGYVTYSNAAKIRQLGVQAALIEEHGAVSEKVVMAMAQGALAASKAQLSLAVTGVAGPTGGSPEKPVGTVWFGWSVRKNDGSIHTVSECMLFAGNRNLVRLSTAGHAIKQAIAFWEQHRTA